MSGDKVFSPFHQFKESLINKSGIVAIVCPDSRFIYWAKEIVNEILGKPLKKANNRWSYRDKVICFVPVSCLDDEYQIRGYNQNQIVYCNGYVTDDYVGIKRDVYE